MKLSALEQERGLAKEADGATTPRRSQRDSKVHKMAELKKLGDIMLALHCHFRQ